jgi:glucose/arabinose dehydrogenase
MLAPEYGGDNAKRAAPGRYPDPLVAFPAHWAPMQMAFYTGTAFPEKYRGGAFVAFHGSWNRAPRPQKGYNVAFVPFDEQGMPRGAYEVFANGFAGAPEIASPRDARYRPCGLAVGPKGSLYVADSKRGRVWRIVYAPEAARAETAASATHAAPAAAAAGPGADLYVENCAVCHMADGAGVPGMQAALAESRMVVGKPAPLIRLLLEGSEAALPGERSGDVGEMPPFTHLSDDEVATLASYVRRTFGRATTSAITAEQVAAARASSTR